MSSDEVTATGAEATSNPIANPVATTETDQSLADGAGDANDGASTTSAFANGGNNAATTTDSNDNSNKTNDDQKAKPDTTDSAPFAPRDVVLAKVKGYPLWPAMVLSEEVLPTNVAKLKPKPQKKKGQPVPVRFFSDDTYIWIHAADLKHLSQEMIQDHFDVSLRKRRKDGMLEAAFAMALDPPEMELFALYGLSLQPDPTAELDDEILEMATDTGTTGGKKRKQPTSETPRKKAATKPATTPKPRKRLEKLLLLALLLLALTKKEVTQITKLPGYDDDWGTDELFVYDKENGDYIFDDEQEQQQLFNDEIGLATEVLARIALANDQFHQVSTKVLQQVVDLEHSAIGDDVKDEAEDEAKVYLIDPQPALDALAELEALLTPEFPKAVYAKLSLMRWLVVLARLPEPQFPYPEVRERIANVLQLSLGFTVPINRPEMMVSADADPTPTPQPEDNAKSVEVKVEANGDAVANGDALTNGNVASDDAVTDAINSEETKPLTTE